MKLKEIFSRFGRKSKENEEDNQNERIDDFAVLEDKELADPIDEYSTDSGIVDDEEDEFDFGDEFDFDEVDYLEQLEQQDELQETEYDEEYDDLLDEYDYETLETEGDEYEDYNYDDYEESTPGDEDLDPMWFENSFDEWGQNGSAIEEESNSVQQQKDKHVSIIPLSEYQDFSHFNEVINRNKEMVSNEELIKRLDVFDKGGSELSKLDKVKKDYITSQIYSSEIQNLTQDYVDNIDLLVENTKLNLAEAHDKVLTVDYEGRALDSLEFDLEEIESKYEDDISDNESKEEENYQNRLNNFMEKQKSELEAFKREQEQRLLDYKEEQLNKKETNVAMFESERTEQYEKEKEKMLSEGVYMQEQTEANRLIPLKREMLKTFETELKDASKDMKDQLQGHLNQIREEIDKKEHEWKVEIHQEEMRDEERRKREIEEERLRLQQQEFELERQERLENLKRKRQQQDNFKRMDDQIQRENDLLRRELNEASLNQSEMNKMLLSQLFNQNEGRKEDFFRQTPMNEPKKRKEEDKKSSIFQRRNIMGGLGLVVVALFAGTTLTMCQNQPEHNIAPSESVREEVNVSQAESDGLDELSKEVSLLREQMESEHDDEVVAEQPNDSNESTEEVDTDEGNTESSDEDRALDSFLTEGSFDEAVEMASNEEELDQIANEMRKQNALVELVNFNQRFDTPYGKLDEYILRDRVWKVFDELMILPNERLLNMRNERRNDVVLYMYQNDFIYYGNWLLENREGESE